MTEDNARWPIGELADRVALALTDTVTSVYPGPPDARVRGVPDIRSIRWYTTIGLLDKPGGYRGRTALYGPRHLRQLVAVKRRQAQGVPLALVQAEMVGLTDAELVDIAGVSPESAALSESVPSATAIPSGRSPGRGDPELPHPETGQSSNGAVRDAAGGDADPVAPEPQVDTRFWSRAAPVVTVADHGRPPTPSLSYGVRLAPGVTVLIEADRAPDVDDLAALHETAAPMLRTLQARGLNRTGADR